MTKLGRRIEAAERLAEVLEKQRAAAAPKLKGPALYRAIEKSLGLVPDSMPNSANEAAALGYDSIHAWLAAQLGMTAAELTAELRRSLRERGMA